MFIEYRQVCKIFWFPWEGSSGHKNFIARKFLSVNFIFGGIICSNCHRKIAKTDDYEQSLKISLYYKLSQKTFPYLPAEELEVNPTYFGCPNPVTITRDKFFPTPFGWQNFPLWGGGVVNLFWNNQSSSEATLYWRINSTLFRHENS